MCIDASGVVLPKKTIAVMGGAFDPIHKDHIAISKQCLELGLCDEVLLMPSPNRWDKVLNADVENRFRMIQMIIEKESRFTLSDMEIQNGDYRGSYVMLQKLQKQNPDCRFRLLVGADTYAGIPRWRDPLNFFGTEYNGEQLLREFELIVFARKGFELPNKEEHAAKHYATLFTVGKENGFEGQFSSTEIRRDLLLNRHVCPPGLYLETYSYIIDHHLYVE